jgi:predicted ATPase
MNKSIMKNQNRFIKYLSLKNFLSFGNNGAEIKCQPLNVFIGPNSSGKSNIIEALRILRATAQIDYEKNISGIISKRDGIENWIWKGLPSDRIVKMQIYTECDPRWQYMIEYNLIFGEESGRGIEIHEESLFRKTEFHKEHLTPKYDYYYQRGSLPNLVQYQDTTDPDVPDHRQVHDLDLNKSILSQRKDPDRFPNITYLADKFSSIRIFRGWNLEYDSPIRKPQKTDKYQDFLEEDGSNLSLIISNLIKKVDIQQLIERKLREFYRNFVGLDFGVEGGIQLRIEEKGLNEKIPATRISDGFLRFLCLLAILCHPNPPPVICIEEPELGLHPDILSTIADLLVEASERTQLFITTHSDVLISALSEHPESVIICERGAQGTNLNRLDKKRLAPWLEDYRLGELWAKGEIGGNP